MTAIKSLEHYINNYLSIDQFKDYCPNGLQVQGADSVKRIVCGVTACEALIHAAIDQSADALLVHHGFFWKGDSPCVTGPLRQRLALLLRHSINLLAYHLPLDVHPIVGNNVGLAAALNIIVTGEFDTGVAGLGLMGELSEPCSSAEFSNRIEKNLNRKPLLISAGAHPIHKIAWCTGAAQDYITQAALHGVDAFISGEVSERTYHLAQELGVHYFAAGHHATERFGVQSMGEHLKEQFNIEAMYIDINNPV